MKLNSLYTFTKAYHYIAILMIILASLNGVLMMVGFFLFNPTYTYYGNDAVGGWATIFSAVGYAGGSVIKMMFLFVAILMVMVVVYFVIGYFINASLKKKLETQPQQAKTLGYVMAIWTTIPGVYSLLECFRAYRDINPINIGIMVVSLVAGVYLFQCVRHLERI